jgi:D-ribose pyranase
LLQAELLGLIARLGHGEMLVLADAGLPAGRDAGFIDLAVRPGLPGILEVLEVVLEAGVFEAGTVATELPVTNADLAEQIAHRLRPRPVNYVSHQELKYRAGRALAVVRTGECTPYANVVLQAGVPF